MLLDQIANELELNSQEQLTSLVHQLEQHVHGSAKLRPGEGQQLLQEVRLALLLSGCHCQAALLHNTAEQHFQEWRNCTAPLACCKALPCYSTDFYRNPAERVCTQHCCLVVLCDSAVGDCCYAKLCFPLLLCAALIYSCCSLLYWCTTPQFVDGRLVALRRTAELHKH